MATETWIQERITATQTAIVAFESARLALAAGAQSYTIDTGQTRSTVTKAQLGEINKTLESLRSDLAEYEEQLAELQGTASTGTYCRPAF